MSKIKTQIVLLSERALPCVLSALDYNLKPERVVLCESDTVHQLGVGRRLGAFLKSSGIKVDYFKLGYPNDFNGLHNKFGELAARFAARAGEVAVNLGDGEGRMAAMAQSVFGAHGFTCVYTVPENNVILEMSGSRQRCYKIQDKLKLTDYFAVQGCRVLNKREKNLKLMAGSHALCRELLAEFERYAKHLSCLTRVAAGAEQHFSLKAGVRLTQENRPLFDLFSRHGFIAKVEPDYVEFAGEADRDFCKGLWLEDYLHQILKGLGKDAGLFDFATFIDFENSARERFELDAAFICRNRLYVVDAKLSSRGERGADDPFALEWLKEFDPRCTLPLVIAFREVRTQDCLRAERMGVRVVQSSELVNLEATLRKMMQ